MKLKYTIKEEKRLKQEYIKIKEQTQNKLSVGAFRHMIRKVAKETEERWNKGMERISKRVAWSKRRFLVVAVSEAQQWVTRIAAGNGSLRERE